MQRKAMKEIIKESEDSIIYAQQPFLTRFRLAFTTKKRRFFYLMVLYAFYHYYERMSKFITDRK